ncbi:4255_t:CDS:2, partial [Racocetra fulgida]
MKFFAISHNYSYLFIVFVIITILATNASAAAIDKRLADCKTRQANAKDAEKLNEEFAKLTPDSKCTKEDEEKGGAVCVEGQTANATLTCGAVPLENSRGTSVICDTEEDIKERIARNKD